MIHLLRWPCSNLVVGFFAILFLNSCVTANAQQPKVDTPTRTLAASATTGFEQTQAGVPSDEEEKERVAAERFLEVLVKRPTTGTALDKVFGYHVAKGDIGEVVQRLSTKAASSKDADESGRHWLLVGLLQLQRGEDAAAVKALAQAQAKLATNPLAAFHHGQALLLIGDTDSAAVALQTALDRKPPKTDYLAIGGQLGRLYQRAGKVDAAIKVWNELERTFPNDDGVRYRIAATLAEEGDLKGALERYDALAKTAKAQNDQMVFAISAADLRIQLGQKEQATKDLEGLLSKLRPNSYLYDDARRRIETAFLSSGDYAGLASYYERWVADHKDDIDAILRLARVLSIQGRSEEALKWFENSIERAPTNTAPRLAMIDAYLADSRFADAAKQYEQLVASDNSNPDYLVRWGQVLMSDTTKTEAERQQAAAAVWKRLAAAKPKDAAIQSQVADLMRGAKLTDEALAGYRTAIRLAPAEPQHKEYLGEYLHQLGRKDEALQVWRSLAAGELRTRENLIRLSEVLHQFEQGDEALKTLAEACTMRPKVHERLRYAEWLRDARQFDKALEQIELARNESETVDERDRVFASSVQTYQATGQLPQRIESARQAAEKAQPNTPATSELWRQLAVLFEANRQTQESLEAIDKAVAAAPTNIETLDIAARMFEEAGRLPLAIEKRRLLADTDRRFRSGHLQRLASLYIQSGNAEAAIAAGREMLSGAGGSVDAFKFYAELCGQTGRQDERIDTLRRCLRLNPRSEDAQQLLATQLAEDFKTEQAIELYWKMLDAASDIEKRRDVVKKLADLYLRTNRLDQLISRIELRGRESGDRRTAIDLTAAAYQQAGDLGLAREALEGLLRESGRDTLLLERLVGLAEQAGEIDKAIELQRQLLRLAPGRNAESKLASLLIDVGATEEAQAIWLSMVEKNSDSQQIAANIDRLFAAGESKVAIELCRKVIDDRPEDWETRLKLAVLLAETGDWDSAAKVSADLSAMKLDDATLPAGAKPKSSQVAAGGVNYQLPIRMARMQKIYELLRILDERYGYQPRTGLPKPIDFGNAKLMALYIKYRSEIVAGGDVKGIVADLAKKANEKDATADTIWDWYESQSIVSTAEQTSGVDFLDPSQWGALWRLAELDTSGEITLAQLFMNRRGYAGRSDLQVRLHALSDEQLVWLKALIEKPRDIGLRNLYGGAVNWETIYATELQIAGKLDEASAFAQARVAKVVADGDANNLVSNLQYLSSHGTDDQLWSVIQKLLATDANKIFQQQYGGKPAASMLSIFAQPNRVKEKLSKGPSDKEYRERLFQLCDALIATESQSPAKRKAIRMTGIGGVRSTYRIAGGSYEQIQILFPPQGLGPEDDVIQALFNAHDLLKEYQAEWIDHLKQAESAASDRGQVMTKLLRACILQWNEKTAEATAQLKEAIDLATKKTPALEPELRLMLADLLLRQDRKQEALQAIELLSVYDQNTMAIREFSAAKLAAGLGDKPRAQAAAKRLFGVRLDNEAQLELAKLMRSLDMRELAADLVRRLKTRSGSNTDQLRTLLTYFQTQDEKEQAAEVAIELLQRTAPTRNSQRNQSRGITTAESQLRKTAMQVLAASGKLNTLIEAAEKRLEQSPKSQRVRAELSELYAGAGKADKAAALYADSKSEDLNSTSGLEAAAKQFVAVGKLDAACDVYLKILRRKPQLFQNEFYEIKRPFDQTKRVGELVDLVIEVGLKKFEGYRVSELCSDLLQDGNDTARARRLYLAILALPPTNNNTIFNLNNVLSNSRSILKDRATLETTVEYLIKCSKNPANDWSTLFQGYSTGSDGRHNNATTSLVRAIAGNEEFCSLTENRVRAALKEKEDWHEGKAWLALVLTVRKQYDEAKTLLAPIANKEMKPQPTYDALWLIGSLIDEHKPMQELAATMYDYAISNTVTNRQSDFQYSLENRICKLMADLGRKERARELILQAVEKIKNGPKTNFNNEDYEAYQKIRTTMSMMDMLASVDYPAEALRLAREMDRSLFAKAGQYQRNLDTEFDNKQKQLLEAVRKLGGLQTAATMVNRQPKGASAVDFGITYGNNPFSQRGIQSLWIDLIEEVQGKPEQAEALSKFVEQLKALSEERKLDDTALAAWAIAADVAGDRQPLRRLLSTWLADSATNIDLKQRHRLMSVAAIRLDRGDAASQDDHKLVDALTTSMKDWEIVDQINLLAELGRQSLSSKDRERGKAIWSKVPQIADASQLQLLDLAIAAANAELSELSIEVALACATTPRAVEVSNEAANKTGSLGELLGSNRTRTPNSSKNNDEPDAAEVQLAKKILELDDTWSNKRVSPAVATQSLHAFAMTSSGRFRPLYTKLIVKNDRIEIDSVFDRLSKHAHEAKQAEKLLDQLKDNSVASHLLATIVLLRDGRSGEAKTHLEAIEPESLQGVPKELVLQSLLLALEQAPCRKRAVELGIALLDQNKPSQQYSEIQPFDTFAMLLLKHVINQNMHKDLLASVANHYLELTQHDNSRYSGSYGFQRRVSQLEEMAKLFLNKGNNDEALKYLGMRQPVFNMGTDSSLDWLGCWALESYTSYTDKKYAYWVVANWTFDGDGALNNIKTIARRQRLPAWIPESVGGNYPTFPPVAEPTLPIATNYFFLAKLAQQTQQIDDLKKRYAGALEKDRAGAVEGLAIALAAWKEPIPPELLDRITKRLDSIDPGQDRSAKGSMPFAEVQLASILASDPNHAEWAKATFNKTLRHAHPLNRGYVHPWLSRFQYQRGWSEAAKLQPANQLAHWVSSVSASAHDYYEGDTPAIWVTDGDHRIDHVCGFGTDFMWLRYPLEGNFEFEVELPSGSWRESGVWYRGIRIASPSIPYFDVQGDEARSWMRFANQDAKDNDWNKYSVKVDGDLLTFSINGKVLYQEHQKSGTPWLALRSVGARSTFARNIKITGKPTIPQTVELIQRDHMRGWTGVYYGQPLPSSLLDKTRQEGDATDVEANDTAKADAIDELSWTVKEGELISGNSQTRGPGNQSLVQYQRPLGDGESLAYEFFYEAGKTEVHPAIGRTAFILRPDGLKLHWMTEPNTSWRTPADYEIPVPGLAATPLPLKSGEWNQLKLERSGQTLIITLNEEKILNQPCELAQGEVFGLFHYADKSSVRVRNARLEGPWPNELPAKLLSTSAK